MLKAIIFFIILNVSSIINAQLLINEAVTGTSSDWVELKLISPSSEKKSLEISTLYVTMYYGTNEKLADSSVTIYSYDRQATSYDDRFIVIHLSEPDKIDETDITGDTNGNGYIDIYCNNYYASLWNSDGVVSIDTDDDPTNNGIIDFIAYSNRDGSPNGTISNYIKAISNVNQWEIDEDDIQGSSIDIGKSGLSNYMSISRKSATDNNTQNNFATTKFQTPGKDNIFSDNKTNRNLFSLIKKKITLIPNRNNKSNLELKIYEKCNIKYRIFSSTGLKVYESNYLENISPGFVSFNLKKSGLFRTGLYIGKIEATSSSIKSLHIKTFFLIVGNSK